MITKAKAKRAAVTVGVAIFAFASLTFYEASKRIETSSAAVASEVPGMDVAFQASPFFLGAIFGFFAYNIAALALRSQIDGARDTE